MKPKQLKWLTEAVTAIPSLFKNIQDGQLEASRTLGERIINGRTVRLSFRAEVVDKGHNPLAGHASSSFPTHTVDKPDLPPIKPRHRKRPNRW